jgi:hypothetical protein
MLSDVGLRNFSATVNGNQVNVERRKETIKHKHPDGREYEGSRNWYTWTVNFPPKKIIPITNRYEVSLSSNQFVDSFEYTLTTGANWDGEIENVDISIVFENTEELQRWLLYVSPNGYIVKDNIINWKFVNLIPKRNIQLVLINKEKEIKQFWQRSMSRMLDEKTYDGNIALYTEKDLKASNAMEFRHLFENDLSQHWFKYIKQFVEEPSLDIFNHFYPISTSERLESIQRIYSRMLRNEIYARHGRLFKSKDLKFILESTDWYKPDPEYSDTMLNDTEKKNVQFILDYEKKMGWR